MGKITIVREIGRFPNQVRISARHDVAGEVGHVYCYLIYDDNHFLQPFALAVDLSVCHEYRHHELNRLLLDELRTYAQSRSATQIAICGNARNKRLRTLLKSIGFTAHAAEFRLEL